MPAVDRRTDQGLLTGLRPQLVLPLPGLQVEPGRPVVRLHVGVDAERLTGLPVVDLVEPVLPGMEHELPALAVLKQDVLSRRGVVIIGVAGRLLEIPVQLPGVEVQRDGRRRVEIPARSPAVRVGVEAFVTAIVIVRIGVADTDEDLVIVIVDRPRLPRAAAAPLPGVALPGRQCSRIIPSGRIEDPLDVTASRIDAEDLALDRILAAVLSDDEQTGVDEGRGSTEADGVLLGVHELLVPEHLPGRLVQCDEVTIGLAHVDPSVADRQAPRVGEERAGDDRFVHLGDIGPEPLPGFGIELPNRRGVGRHVHVTVDDQGCALEAHAHFAGLEDPDGPQLLDITRGDLIERAVPPPGVSRSMVRAPVLGWTVLHLVCGRASLRRGRRQH